jgi:hypothetical protein
MKRNADIGLFTNPSIYNSFCRLIAGVGLSMDIALTPQWFIRTGSQVFYLEYDKFTGSILEFKAALFRRIWPCPACAHDVFQQPAKGSFHVQSSTT